MSDDKPKIRFDFIKSNHYRVVHADGVWGGPTPDGKKLFIGTFAERWPLPKTVVHEFVDGRLGPEIRTERVDRGAVVREIDVGIEMDLEVAKSVLEWLRENIEKAEAPSSEGSPARGKKKR